MTTVLAEHAWFPLGLRPRFTQPAPFSPARTVLSMPENDLNAQVGIYLARLNELIRRGQQLRDSFGSESANGSAIPKIRAWHEECGVTINQLSGGSKAHWLARLFSEAFLMRSTGGQAIEGAPTEEIIERLLNVLEQALAALSRQDSVRFASTSPPAEPHRFDFVHNAEIRPILERTYSESRSALEQDNFDLAMRSYCGILEAIVTDALEHHGLSSLAGPEKPAGNISEWPFESRLAVAEKLGLIRGGCARLPQTARAYREQEQPSAPISEQDAKRASQVLHVIMRDLNPGR
jgi:hypothetical protein